MWFGSWTHTQQEVRSRMGSGHMWFGRCPANSLQSGFITNRLKYTYCICKMSKGNLVLTRLSCHASVPVSNRLCNEWSVNRSGHILKV